MIVELTVPFESNIHGAERRKKDRYASLEYDILELGHQCEVLTIEIGSRGYITKENKERLTNIFKSFKVKKHTNILTSFAFWLHFHFCVFFPPLPFGNLSSKRIARHVEQMIRAIITHIGRIMLILAISCLCLFFSNFISCSKLALCFSK